MYAIQSILVSNTVPLEKAKEHYEHITEKKPRKVRQTKHFYRFRVIPTTKFEKGSFRTKIINDTIRIVFGNIKDENKHLVGGSMFDYFTKAYNYVTNAVPSAFTIDDFSTKTKAYLQQFGDVPITAIQLRRVPISGMLDVALQGLSAGEWERLKTKYGFDKFFHLSMVVTLAPKKAIKLNTGKTRLVAGPVKQLAVEKLEVVSVNENIARGEGMEVQDVPMQGKSFTINEMFTATIQRVGKDKFFHYSALGGKNCQNFIQDLLTTMGVYGEQERQFVFQDIASLVEELPSGTRAAAQGLTDVAGLINKWTGIGGQRKKITLNDIAAMEGGTKASGFIQALMASKSDNPKVKEALEQKVGPENVDEYNKKKFKTINTFELKRLSKTTKKLAEQTKVLTEDEATKRFHDYVIRYAKQHEPKHAKRVNYVGTLDLDGMFSEWKKAEGITIREGRERKQM
jgi:hypothetical protein